MPSTNSQYFYLRELVSPETMNALYNGVGEKLSSYFPIAPAILNGLSYTQTGTTNVISIKDGVIRWVDQTNALSSSPQFTWAAIVAIPTLGVTCPTSATQKYIVAKVTKTQIDLANLSFTGAILPTAYTLAEISALSSPAEYAPLWTITNNSGTYTIGTDTNCAFNYGVNTAANLALYAKLAANNTWTGQNAYNLSPTVPTPAITDTTTKSANMAAINQAVTGYATINVSAAVGGVLTVTDAQYRLQWISFSGTLTGNLIIDVPSGIGKTLMIQNSISQGGYIVSLRKIGYTNTVILPQGQTLWLFSGSSGLSMLNAIYNAVLTGIPTAPTAAIGANTNQIATCAFATGSGFGINQTWQDVIASRAAGVTYTNTTSKPIQVSVAIDTVYTNGLATFNINGILVASAYYSDSNSSVIRSTLSEIVPANSTYTVTVSGATIQSWSELR